MKKIPKLLPISKARESINAIRRIPLENEKADINFIKSRLLPLIIGHTILTPTLSQGLVFLGQGGPLIPIENL
jgi:hypothetical protein